MKLAHVFLLIYFFHHLIFYQYVKKYHRMFLIVFLMNRKHPVGSRPLIHRTPPAAIRKAVESSPYFTFFNNYTRTVEEGLSLIPPLHASQGATQVTRTEATDPRATNAVGARATDPRATQAARTEATGTPTTTASEAFLAVLYW